MRLIGVDFGSVRIGIAVAESEPQVISPRKPLAPSGTLAKDAVTLAELAKNEQADALVLGFPDHENPNDNGKMQRVCRRLADEIEALGVKTHLQDEALSSLEAKGRLTDLTAAKAKKQLDSEAAVIILERFLESLGTGASS